MKFIDPWILWLSLPLTLAAAAALIISELRKKRQLKLLFGSNADWKSVSQLSPVKRWIKHILLIAALPVLAAAAARPYIRMEKQVTQTAYREITVLFDVSKSMRATDLPPSRMEQAKYLLREIVKAFPQDRFALIPFAGNAIVSCPMTLDHHTFDLAVNELSPESVPLGGTDMEAALNSALKSFPPLSPGSRVIILLTDGDELSGSTAAALEKLQQEKIPVIAVGFGSPESAAPVPGDDGKLMRASDGSIAVSRLNEAHLQQIAQATGGYYVRSTVNDTGFAGIKDFLDENIARQHGEEAIGENPDDLFPYFIAAGMVLLFLSAAISDRRSNFPRTAAALLLLIFCCGADNSSNAYRETFQQAYQWQKAGDARAIQLYGTLINDPSAPALLRSRAMQNLALIYQLDGQKRVAAAQNALASENLPQAEKELKSAVKLFNDSKEAYAGAFKLADDPAFDHSRIKNFNTLLKERQSAGELLKKIAELKKLQEKTQQQTQNAQKQNQQDKQQGQNQQNGENNQNSGGQGAKQSAADSRDAAQSAGELADLAGQMKQQKLADAAKAAQKDLQEAEKLAQQGKLDEAQDKLDDAAEKLQSASRGDRAEEPANDAPEREPISAASPVPGKEEKKEAQAGAVQVIELLNDESAEFRKAYQRRQHRYIRRVKKDW